MTSRNLPDSVEAVFPLSPTQQGMLYHSLHSVGSGMYLGQHSLTLNNVNAEVLEEAWQLVVARHSGLRGVFAWRGLSKSVQLVHASVEARIRRVTLPDSEIEGWLAKDALDDFDLTASPPSRVTLLSPATQADPENVRTVFVWTRHHLLVDGWSAHLVLGDLQSAYSALLLGQVWPEQPAPRFSAYIAWLQKSNGEASRSHWTAVLSKHEPQQELGALKAPYRAGGGTRRVDRSLGPEVVNRLEQCRKTSGLTLSALVHGAWAAVLAGFADSERVVLGSTIAGRPADLHNSHLTVGNFINTIPIVVDLGTGQRVTDWLRDLQVQIATSSVHGHVSKRDMLLAANLPPANPLFSSVVVFMNYPKVSSTLGKLEITHSQYDEHSHYPVALLVEPGNPLDLILIHDRAEITAEVADFLLASVAEKLAALPDALLHSTQQFLRPDPALVNHDGDTEASAAMGMEPLTEPIVDVVHALAATVDRYPESCALSLGEHRLTYAEMHRMALTVAEKFTNSGVVAGSNVVIVMPRCIQGMVSIWATLMLGAAYVPLAPSSPPARIEDIAAGCSAALVVTNLAIPHLTVPQLCVASFAELSDELASRSVSPGLAATAVAALGAETTAYQIHTSGSTGKAKRVAVNHLQLAHSLAARLQFYGNTRYRFALLSPLAFDSSVATIYWAAATGGELVLVPEDVVQNPTELSAYLQKHKVTAMLTLPTVYNALLEVAPADLLSTLELVIVAGEACPAELLITHNRNAVNATLVNEYGPTEATVWCAAKKYLPGAMQEFDTSGLPIGTAIPGTGLEVVDTAGRSCPAGVIGELVVHGPIVALPNQDDGSYATGDLVQRLPNGDLLYRGRRDQQIKVRGHRVEASEVEAGVLSHPNVTGCAVVAKAQPPSVNLKILNTALGRLPTAHALALLEEVENASA